MDIDYVQGKRVLGLVEKFRTCLATRDSGRFDKLFANNALKQVEECHDKLRYSLSHGNDSFVGTMNSDFATILRKAGGELMSPARKGMRDDPDNLKELIRVLKEISDIGALGHFQDPNYRLLAIINEVTTWLERREHAFRSASAVPLPKFA